MTGGWWWAWTGDRGGGLDTERVLVLYFRYLSLWPGDFWPGGGGRQGGRGESPCHSPFGDAGRAGSLGNGDGYGGTRDLARCWRPHENEPPRGPFGGGGAPTTTATPRTTTTPSDFCIGGCVWMGASMEWHRGGDTGFEGLVRAVQSTENAHFNEASEPVVQDCRHSGEIPEG